MPPAISKTPSFLFLKRGIYHLRLAVPPDLQNLVGRAELRYSLRTGFAKDARRLAMLLAAGLKDIFAELRARKDAMTKLTEQDVPALIREYIRHCLERDERARIERHLRENSMTDVEKMDEWFNSLDKPKPPSALGIAAQYAEDLRLGRYGRIAPSVAAFLEKQAIEFSPESLPFTAMCREALKTQEHIQTAIHYREQGNYGFERSAFPDLYEPGPVMASGPASPGTQVPKELLSETIRKYVEDKEYKKAWTVGSVKEAGSKFDLFLRIVGDMCTADFNHAHAERYYETLKALPPRALEKVRQHGGIDQVVKMAANGKWKPMSLQTVDNHLTQIKGVLGSAVDRGLLNKTYLEGYSIPSTRRDDEHREPFTVSDLRVIFNHSIFTAWIKGASAYRFWLPVIALYTGMRMNEICQLHLSDIRRYDNIWYFDINDNSEDKSLKTKASKRKVPLHPFLTDHLKLPKYAERLRKRKQDRLFPEIKRSKNYRYSKHPSKWFSQIKSGLQLPDEKAKNFHSFRHTFVNELDKALIPDQVRDDLCGHTQRGEGRGRYAKRYHEDRVPILYREGVLKLNFPGLDLSHLKDHPLVKCL